MMSGAVAEAEPIEEAFSGGIVVAEGGHLYIEVGTASIGFDVAAAGELALALDEVLRLLRERDEAEQ